jgi:hypothetical protein
MQNDSLFHLQMRTYNVDFHLKRGLNDKLFQCEISKVTLLQAIGPPLIFQITKIRKNLRMWSDWLTRD